MSLYRLLLSMLVVLIISLTLSNMWLYLRATQSYLNDQLAAHARDTNTSLGLSLSAVLAQQDWVLAQSMVDAIFDSGEYRLIQVEAQQGDNRIVRISSTHGEHTPDWFQQLLPLQAPIITVPINQNWRTVAQLQVQVNPARAQDHLWRLIKQAIINAALLGGFALLFGVLLLKRILKPLIRAKHQADGIRHRHYIKQEHLPHTTELRSLVQAMNLMVENSEAVFKEQCRRIERFRHQSLQDPDTRLGNLVLARKHLNQLVRDRELDGGTAARLHLVGLDKVELASGVEGEHSLMQALANLLNEWVFTLPHAQVYRYGFAEFLLLLPGLSSTELAQWEQPLRQRCLTLLRQKGGEQLLFVATEYQLDADPNAIEATLESLLSDALRHNEHSVFLVAKTDRKLSQNLQQQEDQLTELLKQRPRLLAHPVLAASHTKEQPAILYCEILTRFHDGLRSIAPGPVMVMAARQQRHQSLDLCVLDAVLLHRNSAFTLAINLTVASVLDPLFLPQIKLKLQSQKGRIALEIPERAYLIDPENTERFISAMASIAVPVWLDHASPASLPLLLHSGLTGIKLDPTYTRASIQQEASRNSDELVEMMIAAAHARQVLVVAEQVDDAKQIERLWQLGLDGIQGFALTPPKPLGAKDGPTLI